MTTGIITGGTTGEREISFASAKNIQETLGVSSDHVFDYPANKEKIKKMNGTIDVFIPVIHGKGGEDGEVQLLLEEIKVPYIFSAPDVHKTALDKRATKKIAEKAGIKTAKEFSKDEPFTGNVFVKPLSGGSSVHTALISTPKDLAEFLSLHKETEFLIEQALEGREFSVGVIEHDGRSQALPVVEIKPKGSFFDYESKYDESMLAEEVCPAEISETLASRLQEQALQIHNSVGCKHISRSDFIVTNDRDISFLEINTIPGMTNTSLVPKEVRAAKLSMKDLLEDWIDSVI